MVLHHHLSVEVDLTMGWRRMSHMMNWKRPMRWYHILNDFDFFDFFGTKKIRPMGWTQIILLGSKPKFSGMIDHHRMWRIKFVPWDDKLSSSQFLTVFDKNRPMGRKKIVPWPIIPWDDRVKSSHGTKKNRFKKSVKSCDCDVWEP